MDITVACRFWHLKMPLHWSFRNDEECVTFTGDPDLGALQLSVREKETTVDNDDLRAFAADRADAKSHLEPIVISSLVGFYAQTVIDETLWREWWLRAGRVMVYITYNVEAAIAEGEGDIIDAMVSTLRLRDEGESQNNVFAFL